MKVAISLHADAERTEWHNEFESSLSLVRAAIATRKWLAQAYISWYRGVTKISLYEFIKLDDLNCEAFRLMCNLRNVEGWNDQQLFELEKFAKQHCK